MTELFRLSDITDVRIIIEANGKHYSISPNKETSHSDAKNIRRVALEMVLGFHDVVIPSLEEIDSMKQTLLKKV